MRRFALLFLVILLVSCTAARQDTKSDLFSLISKQPGVRVSMSATPPAGFQVIDGQEVYALYHNQQPIWFHAPDDELLDDELRQWLRAVRALHFPNGGQDLYWIPPTDKVDTLAYAKSLGLVDRLAAEQQRDLWRQRGDYLRQQREFEAAVLMYEKAVAAGNADVQVYAGLGAALLGLGRNEEAATALEHAVTLAPDDYWAHRLLGNAYLKLLRYPLALDELTQAYILRPEDRHLLLGVALAQGRMGDTSAALATLDQLLAQNPSSEDVADAQVLRQEFSTNTP